MPGAAYVDAAALTPEQTAGTADGDPDAGAPVWSTRQAALLRAVDELRTTAALGDAAWEALRTYLDDAEAVELLVLAGWYRTIAYVANAVRLPVEPWAVPAPFPAATG